MPPMLTERESKIVISHQFCRSMHIWIPLQCTMGRLPYYHQSGSKIKIQIKYSKVYTFPPIKVQSIQSPWCIGDFLFYTIWTFTLKIKIFFSEKLFFPWQSFQKDKSHSFSYFAFCYWRFYSARYINKWHGFWFFWWYWHRGQ